MIFDTPDGYGLVSRLLHWIMAAAVLGTFALGWWMVGLDYYSPYYKSAPDLHRAVGVMIFMALLARLTWRAANVKPSDAELSPMERRASRLAHKALYVLLLALSVSGYLISTADGRAIDVFGLLSIPSLIESKGLEDIAGAFHEYLAYALIALSGVHAAAAFKHHFMDRDRSLSRMWSGPPSH